MEDKKVLVDKESPLRHQTLSLGMIDADHLGRKITQQWRKEVDSSHDADNFRADSVAQWRDFSPQQPQGPWDNQSRIRIPMTFINIKAAHARMWQLFGDIQNFFTAEARKEVFEDKEMAVKQFMTFVIESWVNFKTGMKDTFDDWLQELIADGSGYLKVYWDQKMISYLDVEPVVNISEVLGVDSASLTGVSEKTVNYKEENVLKREVLATPQVRRIPFEDVRMPQGQSNPQLSDWVAHRILMSGEDIKQRALFKRFDKSVAEQVLAAGMRSYNGNSEDEIKQDKAEIDGYNDITGYFEDKHFIIEWYGRAYIKKEITDERDLAQDINEFPEEIVAWVHQGTGKVLGWTYLHRVSPSGIRPIFKGDFVKVYDRTTGVGAAELLAGSNQAVNMMYNIRIDNGKLSSTPWGVYQASSSMKPDKLRISHGELSPVDDVNAVKFMPVPFLSNFAYQDEDRLNAVAERLMAQSDLQLGRTPTKVGVFRTASGSNQIQAESQIQLDIHFDRLERCLSPMLQCLFALCRERMPTELYYRVTGDTGEPIFGKVNREALRGEFDFRVNVDILGESRADAQQKAVMAMQTLINPAFTNTGIVGPTQLYHLAKNFLMKYRFKRIDNYLAKPQGYTGEVIPPADRIFRIVVGMYKNPPIEDLVRLDDDHEAAMKTYQGFEESDEFGLLSKPEQLAAFQKLKDRQMQMMQAAQAGGNPNMTGMQVPREGFAPMEAGGADQGSLGAPEGEVNGPVV